MKYSISSVLQNAWHIVNIQMLAVMLVVVININIIGTVRLSGLSWILRSRNVTQTTATLATKKTLCEDQICIIGCSRNLKRDQL